MSTAKKITKKSETKAVTPVSLNEKESKLLIENELMDKIKKELNEAFDILLEMYTVQIAMYYTLGYLGEDVDSGHTNRFADDIDGKRDINHADIVFGVRRALKRSADIAHERALHIAEFDIFTAL